MSQKYDEYLEKHRQAVKKAYQWIAAYIPELTDVEATRNIEFHDMSKNTPDEYTPYDNYFYGEQSSRRLTGHGLCISTETPIIVSIGS